MKSFNAKILLFGEYAIINGGEALAMPHATLTGKLSPNGNADLKSTLLSYGEYLCENTPQINANSFVEDVSNGLLFETNIPIGYGAGSSGVLAACVYDKYKTENLSKKDIIQVLKSMEDFFHGKSSGLDPAVSYFNSAIHVSKEQQFNFVEVASPDLIMFLADTQIHRKTAPYVNLFLEKLKDESYKKTTFQNFHAPNNEAIASMLNNEDLEMYKCFKHISTFQWKHMREMIPKKIHPAWEQGLRSNKYYLKLCGAGGGGYMLGITNQFNFELNGIPTTYLF